MKDRRNRLSSVLTALCMVLALLPAAGMPAEAASDPLSGIFDISEGDIIISHSLNPGKLVVSYNDPAIPHEVDDTSEIIIIGSSSQYRVEVSNNMAARITLRNVRILLSSWDPPFHLKHGAGVSLTLEGDNMLEASHGIAGLCVYPSAALTITKASTGTLTARSQSGAGIGNNSYGSSGDITIEGGTVIAASDTAAGIGGGYGNIGGAGGAVTITGGTVTATSNMGAGIGGGYGASTGGAGGTVTITGGTVTAASDMATGIGGGYGDSIGGAGGTINITGGTVTATSNGSADIGGGAGGTGGANAVVTISGGSVHAGIPGGVYDTSGQPVGCNILTVGSPAVVGGTAVTAGLLDGVPMDVNAGAGVYGIRDVYTDAGGAVYFWLQDNPVSGAFVQVTAGGRAYGQSYTRFGGGTQTLTAAALTVTAPTFADEKYGYVQPAAQDITISNTGGVAAAISNVTVTAGFALSGSGAAVPAGGSIDTWKIVPDAGLAAGTHTATITVQYDSGETATGSVRFRVTGSSSGGTAAGISPRTAEYDQAWGGTVATTLSKGSYTLRGIRYDGRTLTENVDYTVSGAEYRLSGFFLSTLKAGTHTLTFRMSGGGDPVLTVTVTNSAHNCPSARFTDVDTTRWYHGAVDYAVESGLMQGVAADRFQPGGNVSRVMAVTVLWRLEGSPSAGETDFSDVAPGLWYSAAVDWAAESGIVNGYGNGRFGPGGSITREQLAAMLHRYSVYKGLDVSASGSLEAYADADSISGWARIALAWANGEGFITGRSETELAPRGITTRAELAEILHRFTGAAEQ